MNFDEYHVALNKALKRQKLSAVSQFSKHGFFDEIPLYSRVREVEFLEPLGQENADLVLIGFGLQYLESIVKKIKAQPFFFAALTFWDFSEEEYLVPNIFVCNGEVENTLLGKLILRQPQSWLSVRVKKAINKINLKSKYQVMEDADTLRECVRVLVGHRVPASQSMLTVSNFTQ